MTTQILTATGTRATVLLAAALDSGRLGDADRRVLLLTGSGTAPEAAPPASAMPGFESLRARFDDVLSYDDAIAPLHPSGWVPRADDAPLWERHLRRLWGLGDDTLELVVESLHTGPARALAAVFTGTPVDVYATGSGAHAPTGAKIPPLTGTRVRRLIHPGVFPGLGVRLLSEYGAEPLAVPASAQIEVYTGLAEAAGGLPGVSAPALLIGEGLAEAGLLTGEEERELHLGAVRALAALGHTQVVFAPHDAFPVPWAEALVAEAEGLGAGLTVLDAASAGAPVLPEVLCLRLRPAVAVGSFSPGLLAASALFGVPVATVGTGALLEGLTPYEHDARVPVTLADAVLPALDGRTPPAVVGSGAAAEQDGLVAAVAFAMQPRVRPDLRPAAELYLSTRLTARTWRYFKRRRLASLALPGVVPARLAPLRRSPALRRLARRARALKRG
ncbi:hypothetical protein [Streptomyces nitrosporeus]|uniref:hypothetical protein n=1 Tax=Streptomyces nitrosporeus TaxID=28894 RepID=UPI0039A18D3F